MNEVLHIYGIPADNLSSEAIVIKLEFDDLDTAFNETNQESERIL